MLEYLKTAFVTMLVTLVLAALAVQFVINGVTTVGK
jgi:small neutral amino acid transporter SnatA (MarC family)